MRRYIIYISVLFFLVGSTHLPSYAIVQDEADNSFYAVAGMEENIDKVNSLLGLSQYYRDIDKDSALMCCDMALELSKRLEYFEGIAGSYYKKSLIYKNSGNYIAARECANKTLGIAEALQDSMLLAKTNYHLGNIIKNLSNNKPALNHYSKALSIYINKKDTLRLTAVYNGFGNYFLERGIYNFAATYYHKALQFAKVVDQEQSQGKILNNLGTVYFELGEYDHSRKYLDASSEIAWKYSDNGEKANILTRLGNLELNLKNFTKAYENYYLADSLFRIDDEAEGIHNTYINFGFLFLEQGKPKKALKNFDIALAYYNEQDLAKGKTAAW
ncbi:MAG: tetratricopeptide repeat protein, partial [Bacteroidota bacterium]|nr:tetratricopeptide repeat protein [Bacteroidota bacterium]